MRVRAVITGIVGLVAIGVTLTPTVTVAQWGRPRVMGGYGRYGEATENRYGGGYGYQGGQAPSYGGYPPAGYAAPPPAYGAPGGYPAPAPGYPPQGYPPAGYPPPAYQQPYAYPPPGQNPQQASANQMQCQEWATTQSGYNPNAPTQGTTSSQSQMAGAGSVTLGSGLGKR